MNMIAVVAFAVTVMLFGPWFLVQAGIGYLIGSGCGAYASSRMRRLHFEICRHTRDRVSDIDELADYTMRASQIGGAICPIVPLISVVVGMVCAGRADRLGRLLPAGGKNETKAIPAAARPEQPAQLPQVGQLGFRCGTGVRL